MGFKRRDAQWRANDDALLLELAAKLRAVDLLTCAGATHEPARAVTRRAERALHRARLARAHEADRSHASRDEHRLSDVPIGSGDLVRSSGEGPGRPFAMDEYVAPPVALDLGDVVRHVVDL